VSIDVSVTLEGNDILINTMSIRVARANKEVKGSSKKKSKLLSRRRQTITTAHINADARDTPGVNGRSHVFVGRPNDPSTVEFGIKSLSSGGGTVCAVESKNHQVIRRETISLSKVQWHRLVVSQELALLQARSVATLEEVRLGDER